VDNKNNNGTRSWTELFRLITPFFLFILTLLAGQINSKINNIDEKLFIHLTNDEMHTPKSIVISKAEFSIYQEMRKNQMENLEKLQRQTSKDMNEGFNKINDLIVQLHAKNRGAINE
jgi:hypothetical protein